MIVDSECAAIFYSLYHKPIVRAIRGTTPTSLDVKTIDLDCTVETDRYCAGLRGKVLGGRVIQCLDAIAGLSQLTPTSTGYGKRGLTLDRGEEEQSTEEAINGLP